MTNEEISKNIKKCKNCGAEFYSVKDEYKCTKCGYINRVKKCKYKKHCGFRRAFGYCIKQIGEECTFKQGGGRQ